ncbi:TraK family protein [Pseudomonas corrugata]|uniref:TraK family protein n=1 Tax=Pseudomonas corrugata TaxID=47879 RepID=UPI000A6A44EC|nr:TraK family protein [Pseudomonas corrugata]
MTNWRTLPRTGKSQFIPLIPEIEQRLNLGQTYKQIHDALVEAEQVTLGYQQFVKYIKKLLKVAQVAQVAPKTEAPGFTSTASEHTGNHPFAHLAANRGNRRHLDADIHNPVPNHKKIYGE